MLKDVGMTVPKSGETSACNSNSMHNPKIKDEDRVMIVACPHPLSCCIYTPLVSLLFGTVIQHFNGNFFTSVSLVFRCILQLAFSVCEPHSILLLVVI